jgi:uncharacterized protein
MLKPIDNQKQPSVTAPSTRPTSADLSMAQAQTAMRFANTLNASHLKVGQETMVAFLAEIDEQGKKLLKHPIRGEIERYRGLVGKFLKEASQQMNVLEKHLDRRNKAFILIKEVDKRLSELTDMILKGQGKQLDILNKLNEIHGMLIDLLI